ncbi:hypothetical protein BCR33DRAFT_734576 [Rhizoclosmatium globosum]|uniref:G-protein coupled receptors family 1 profile domain-containing protein n=1 Tax=Rhizoclosmatium globosum TaxID=329046 RepID=A0A1Y2CTX5_9FUNG|nr:hypothetical protein BCR33DRAFT_734576 [Rhizoclosmatium globosum]|eukprot:ORY49795.1 hypothetical protein BCR33DRAFT_734576 [Rhizoclosmatium globosum]
MFCDLIRNQKWKIYNLYGSSQLLLECFAFNRSPLDDLLKGDNPSDLICRILGGFLSVFMFAELFLIDVMALFMLLTVYYGNRFSLGSYDWMLFVVVIGGPICYSIIAGADLFDQCSVGALGHDYYWCFLDISVLAGRIMWSITAAAACLCVALPAVCYYLIYRRLKEHANFMKEVSNNANTDFTAAIIKKLLVFQGIVTFTFCGIASYGICIAAFQTEPTGLVWLTVLTINSGGWVNAVAYYLQEYVFSSRDRSKVEASKNSTGNASKQASKTAISIV